jgi:uncharacterized membrane protein
VDALLAFFGRLHPLVVHFPIALTVFAVGLWGWSLLSRSDRLKPTLDLVVSVSAVSAVVACILGLLWAQAEDFRGAALEHIETHKWLALSGTGLAVLAAALWRGQPDRRKEMKALVLIAATTLIGASAHMGGTSVHGDDHFSEPFADEADEADEAPAPAQAPVDVEAPKLATLEEPAAAPVAEAGPDTTAEKVDAKKVDDKKPEKKPDDKKPEKKPDDKKPKKKPDDKKPDHKQPEDKKPEKKPGPTVDFKKDVWPIFKKSCIKCHGKKKKKGDLRMDTKANLAKGGENGEVVVPGDAKASKLYELIALDPEHEDYMPAKGDPLTAKQVETIRRWIDEGAHWPE